MNNRVSLTPDEYKAVVEFSRSQKRNKYRNKRETVGAIKFASKSEAARWSELKLLEKHKAISDLRRQVRIPLYVNQKLVTTYIADFVYRERGREIVEDSKGMLTPEFKLKAKLYAALFGSEILITGKGAKGEWIARKVQNRGAA